MQSRTLGTSGIEVSVVGLGCNNFGARIDREASEAVINAAIEHGITLFDTADIYGNRGGSETIIGEVLGDRRKDIVLATKFGMEMDEEGLRKGGCADYIVQAVEDSLRRLKTDWIDLYQMHAPDADTPIEETLGALDQLVQQGKVRAIGCSNFRAWQVVDALWTSETRGRAHFVTCQDEYSLLRREVEADLIPAMRAKGPSLLPYFPLASGMLSGKYQRHESVPEGTRFAGNARLADKYMTDANWALVEKLSAFATEGGKTLLDLAFAWLLAQEPVVSVIAGATKPEQVVGNVRAGGWVLTKADLEAIPL